MESRLNINQWVNGIMSKNYRFSITHKDPAIRKLLQEIEDNYVAKDKDGNEEIDGDITAKDAHLDEGSLYLGKIKISAPKAEENEYYLKAVRTASKQKTEWVETSNPVDHASAHELGGGDTIDHDNLTNFVANEHLPGIDEDDMLSDSDAHVPTQQSVKAYADTKEPLIVAQSHIVDADDTLADITTKFNTLLAQLENLGLLATS